MSYLYRVYGFNLACEFPLPELDGSIIPENSPADVSIRKGSLGFADLKSVKDNIAQSSPEETLLVFPAAGAFRVRQGREILVEPAPRTSETGMIPFILGAVMSILLSQRGLAVLHASCVWMREGAEAFIGHKGQGKSVMVASLAQRGYTVLADDVTAVLQSSDPPQILPASLQIRLLPDALDAFGYDANMLPKVHPVSPKRNWQPPSISKREAFPLHRIYVLTEDNDLSIDLLSPTQAFVELLRHAYLSRWPQITSRSETHFSQIASLANNVPVFRLRRPRQFSLLPQLIEMLENSPKNLSESS